MRLDRAQPADGDGLFAALDAAEVWAMGYSAGKPRPTAPVAWRDAVEAAAKEDRVMYTVRLLEPGDAAGRIVGTTSLGDVDVHNEKLHLGWTAYSPGVWGTSVNPECKLLLLTHAFDDCGFGRVKLRTDVINTRSQAAIAKLGAVREGVARRHIRRSDGSWRDSVIYSILRDEWPAVRAGLQRRLGRSSAQ